MRSRPLTESHPELAGEAVGWDPATVSAGTNKKLTWQCAAGHHWDATPNNRSNGSGCPYCAGRRVLSSFNDLNTTHPHLTAEVVTGDTTTVSAGSHKEFRWRCASGHEWEAPVSGRARGEGCPVCAGRVVIAGANDLATVARDIASELVDGDSTTITVSSNRRFTWRCALGHEWRASANARSRGSNCPVCANQRVEVGFNDLWTTRPELAAQVVDGADPSSVTARSGKRCTWRCDLGHEWEARVADRSSGRGCPVCANQRLEVGFNDLATKFPEVAAQANGWDPTTVTAGINRKYPWLCEKGHEWSATIGSRTSGVGCPYCSGKAVIQGETDLATRHPDLVTEVVQGDPTKVSAGSEKRFRWRCDEGHEWDAIVANRANGVGCPVCSNQLLSVGHNDLATVRPDLVRQLVDTDPTTVLAGSARKCRWRCDEGHEWTTAVNARMSGRGCPSCAKYGFDPGSPAWIYLLEHPTWNLLQVGITNVPEVRLNQHGRLGWEVLDLRGPMDGVIARSWESSILHLLKSSGGIMATKEIAGKFSGFTEAWSMGSYPVTSLRELMDAVDGAES